MPSVKQFDPAKSDKRWMWYVFLFAVLSWLGLWTLVQLPVTGPTRVLFFVLLLTGITSTTMPPIAYLNARFGRFRNQRTFRARFIRQSIWLGLLIVVLGWLQMRRILSTTLAMILTAVFALIETFILTREHPQSKT
jgi:hypothetical protein